jgi:hypothetical protein
MSAFSVKQTWAAPGRPARAGRLIKPTDNTSTRLSQTYGTNLSSPAGERYALTRRDHHPKI